MSDVADGSGPVPRRSPRSSDGGAPVSGALAIVLAVVAVVAGFFILRSISGDDKKRWIDEEVLYREGLARGPVFRPWQPVFHDEGGD